MLVRYADELAGQVVGPAMIATDQLATGGSGIVADDRSTPMPAGIVESVDLIVLIPNDQYR